MDAQGPTSQLEKQNRGVPSATSYGKPAQTSNTQHSSGYKDKISDEIQYTTPFQKIAAVNKGDNMGTMGNDNRG